MIESSLLLRFGCLALSAGTAWYLLISPKAYFVEIHKGVLARVVGSFHDAGYAYEEHTVVRLAVMSIVVSGLFGYVLSLITAVLLPIAMVISVFIALRVKSQKYLESLHRNNDKVCFSLARTLRSGQTLSQAIQTVSIMYPHTGTMNNITMLMEKGISFNDALTHTVENSKSFTGHDNALCATLMFAHNMGGNSARIFERMGEYFHQTYEMGNDSAASLSQVKLSAWVVGLLPVVMLCMSALLGTDSISFLLTQPLGWVCLLCGLTLEIAGIAWMRKQMKESVGIWIS